jgi:transposase
LRDEYGFGGGYTIVKDYVRLRNLSGREMFVPLDHPPGDAQVDFGEAAVVIAGVERKAHYFVMDLPQSDARPASAGRRPPLSIRPANHFTPEHAQTVCFSRRSSGLFLLRP